jgi:LCP family protein required for cell wall assembly
VLILGTSGVGHAVVSRVDTGIGRVDPFQGIGHRPAAGHGTTFLLVGTDGRERITAEEKERYRLGGAPCDCTDTVMLVHLAQDGRRAAVVSLPRDSYTMLPGVNHGRPQKLNAAYAQGGPSLTVRAVEGMTRVKVDHYLEVDFTAFMRTVDALGGVEICTPRPLHDPLTGLDLTAGRHLLDGGQALQYVRSRHVAGDATADLGRMRRQQRFVAALLHRAAASGALLDPAAFRSTATGLLRSMRADPGFGPRQLLGLARALRGLSPASTEFVSVPVHPGSVSVPGAGSLVRWDTAAAAKLFGRLRADRPLVPPSVREAARRHAVRVPVDPRTVRVQVYNGTTKDGLAARVDRELRATGFRTTGVPLTVARPGPADRRTVIRYDPRWDRSAASLAAALPGSELRAVQRRGPVIEVVAGTDVRSVRAVRSGPAPRDMFHTMTGDEAACR